MKDPSGMTLVMLAAAGGQDDLLRLLLRRGAKVNGRQKNGTTALIHAAEKVSESLAPASPPAGAPACGMAQSLCPVPKCSPQSYMALESHISVHLGLVVNRFFF